MAMDILQELEYSALAELKRAFLLKEEEEDEGLDLFEVRQKQ